MMKIKSLIGMLIIIGFFAIIYGFKTNPFTQNRIDIENKSTTDYKVCVYCYGQEEGSFNLGWGDSTTVKVPCQVGSLEIKYGSYSCNNSALSSGYNSFTLN